MYLLQILISIVPHFVPQFSSVIIKEYRLQLRKPHLGDFHLVCFVITANFALSRGCIFCEARYQKMVFYLSPRASSGVSKTNKICWICYEKTEKKPNLVLRQHFAHALLTLCSHFVNHWYFNIISCKWVQKMRNLILI